MFTRLHTDNAFDGNELIKITYRTSEKFVNNTHKNAHSNRIQKALKIKFKKKGICTKLMLGLKNMVIIIVQNTFP